MDYPPLVTNATEAEFRVHFERVYCQGPIETFDGIQVRFRKSQFDHAFFESKKAKDDTFSLSRAERIDWIKAALLDNGADLRVGWDNQRRCSARDRRVAIVKGNYVLIIRLLGSSKSAEFVTAFVADSSTIQKIRKSSKWPRSTSPTSDCTPPVKEPADS